MKTKFIPSNYVSQGCIVVGSGERVRLLRVDGEYVPRHGCSNPTANKIRVENIYHDKRHGYGKTG